MPQSTVFGACTAQRNDGSFCNAPTLPSAPFPICIKHAAKVMQFLRDSAEGATMTDQLGEDIPARVELARVGLARQRRDVVYYLAIDDLIKIGTTITLESRLKQYPPTARLLGVEPGDRGTEQDRLQQFAADLVAGREWFRRSPELEAHIASLPKIADIPDVDASTWDSDRPELNGAVLSTAEAASLVGVNPTTVRNWVRRGFIKACYKDRHGAAMFWASDVVSIHDKTQLRRSKKFGYVAGMSKR